MRGKADKSTNAFLILTHLCDLSVLAVIMVIDF